MAEIELGVLPSESSIEDQPLARSWIAARWVRLGAVLVVLLGTMAAAGAAPAPLAAATIAARLGATVVTGLDRLFVVDPVDTTAEPRQQLAAFRLPDGAPLWRVRMPVLGPLGGSALVGHTLVLTSDWGSVAPRQTVAVDAVTGAVAWRRTASLDTVTASGDMLLWTPELPDNLPGVNETGPDYLPAGTLQAVAPGSGQARWSASLPAGTMRTYGEPANPIPAEQSAPHRPGLMVTRLPSGLTEVRDLASGAVVVRSADLTPVDPDGGGRWPLRVFDDLLLARDSQRSVGGYGLDRLDQRWTIEWEVDQDLWPMPCGDALCLFRPQGGVRMLELTTGRVRWEDPRWVSLLPVGAYLVTNGVSQSSAVAELIVLDPATGRRLGGLGSWNVIGFAGGGTRLTGVRFGPDGRTLVAELDPALRSARVLAVVSDVSGDCQSGAGLLICRRLNGEIGVWRLPA